MFCLTFSLIVLCVYHFTLILSFFHSWRVSILLFAAALCTRASTLPVSRLRPLPLLGIPSRRRARSGWRLLRVALWSASALRMAGTATSSWALWTLTVTSASAIPSVALSVFPPVSVVGRWPRRVARLRRTAAVSSSGAISLLVASSSALVATPFLPHAVAAVTPSAFTTLVSPT